MSRLFVSIWFPHLIPDWHCKKNQLLQSNAFVTSISQRGRLQVKAANMLAKKTGIHVGMNLADARALSPGLEVIPHELGMEEKLLKAIAEYCIRFSPVTAVDAEDGILLEATGCCHLWKNEANYIAVIRERFLELGYITQIAVAPSIGGAWALARYAAGTIVLHKDKLATCVQSLPAAALRIDAEIILKLHRAGLYNIGLLLNMPATALRRRFGKALLTRLAQLISEEEEWIQSIETVPAYLEQLPCLEPIFTAKAIEMAIQQLLDQLCKRLQKEQKGLRVATLTCYRVDHKKIAISIGTNNPSSNAVHLFKLFQLKIETIAPGFGIEMFTMAAGKVQDAKPVQDMLWNSPKAVMDQELSELIDRVRLKLPGIQIFNYQAREHFWPERSFKADTVIAAESSSEWIPTRPRPISILKTPQLIRVTAPVPDYPPLNFSYKGQLHKIVKADGPERIEPEWWIAEGRHRDYYYVEDEQGYRYWLFRYGHYNAMRTEQWFLHGFFP